MQAESSEEAVIIYLDGQGLDHVVYELYDLSTLEDLLSARIEQDRIGQLDGHEISPTQTVIYLYGPDAEEIFSRVQPVLSIHPLCNRSRVIVRGGAPGASQREVAFPFS